MYAIVDPLQPGDHASVPVDRRGPRRVRDLSRERTPHRRARSTCPTTAAAARRARDAKGGAGDGPAHSRCSPSPCARSGCVELDAQIADRRFAEVRSSAGTSSSCSALRKPVATTVSRQRPGTRRSSRNVPSLRTSALAFAPPGPIASRRPRATAAPVAFACHLARDTARERHRDQVRVRTGRRRVHAGRVVGVLDLQAQVTGGELRDPEVAADVGDAAARSAARRALRRGRSNAARRPHRQARARQRPAAVVADQPLERGLGADQLDLERAAATPRPRRRPRPGRCRDRRRSPTAGRRPPGSASANRPPRVRQREQTRRRRRRAPRGDHDARAFDRARRCRRSRARRPGSPGAAPACPTSRRSPGASTNSSLRSGSAPPMRDLDPVATRDQIVDGEPSVAIGDRRRASYRARAPRPDGSAAASAASGSGPICTVRSSIALATQRTRAPAPAPPRGSSTFPNTRAPRTSSSTTSGGAAGRRASTDRRPPQHVARRATRTAGSRPGTTSAVKLARHDPRTRASAADPRRGRRRRSRSGPARRRARSRVVDHPPGDRRARRQSQRGRAPTPAPSPASIAAHDRRRDIAGRRRAARSDRRPARRTRSPRPRASRSRASGHPRRAPAARAPPRPPRRPRSTRPTIERPSPSTRTATPSAGADDRVLLGGRKPSRLDQQAVRPQPAGGRRGNGRQVGRGLERAPADRSAVTASGNASTRASGTGRSRRSTTRSAQPCRRRGPRTTVAGRHRPRPLAPATRRPSKTSSKRTRGPPSHGRAGACLRFPSASAKGTRLPEGFEMAAHCEVCGKQRRVANNVSHSNIKTKSIQRPNLRRVHAKPAERHAHTPPRLHPLPAHGLGREGLAPWHRASARAAPLAGQGNSGWQTRPIVT